jgi:hypothetical protein
MRRELSWWDRVDAIVGWLSVGKFQCVTGPLLFSDSSKLQV